MANRSRIRPRTRVYDSNYNIGESYYRPALDRLDRKYSGRPTSPPRQTSLPRDLMDRHAEAFADEDLPTARRRAEKHITEDHMFDSRGGRTIGIRPRSSALNVEDGFDEEIRMRWHKIKNLFGRRLPTLQEQDMLPNTKIVRIKAPSCYSF